MKIVQNLTRNEGHVLGKTLSSAVFLRAGLKDKDCCGEI